MARRRHTKLLQNLLAVRKQKDLSRGDFERLANTKTKIPTYSYQKSVAFLVDRGLIKAEVQLGSIPENHLSGMCEFLQQSLNSSYLKGIQVGTYVGISLAYLCDFLRQKFEDGTIISIDPNLSHRGIDQPVNHAIELLNHFGLLNNVMLLNGYSLQKSLSNDGVNYFEKYDPKKNFDKEHAPANQLEQLSNLAPKSFDFILLDGNHNSVYLRDEIELSKNIIKPNGFVILDDVNQSWSTIENVFNNAESIDMKKVYFDGRIGILAKMENSIEALILSSE